MSPPPATETSLPSLVRCGRVFGRRHRGPVEWLDLEGAERAVPDQRRGAVDPAVDGLDGFRADIEDHARRRALASMCDCFAGGARLEFPGDDAVDRQDDARSRPTAASIMICLAVVGKIVLAQRLADIGAARGKEGVGHAAADDQRVDLLHEVHQQVDLGRDLGAADDGDDRARRIAEALFQRVELGLHGAAGEGREMVRQPSVEANVRGGRPKRRR